MMSENTENGICKFTPDHIFWFPIDFYQIKQEILLDNTGHLHITEILLDNTGDLHITEILLDNTGDLHITEILLKVVININNFIKTILSTTTLYISNINNQYLLLIFFCIVKYNIQYIKPTSSG
jgi:hypothetical protein